MSDRAKENISDEEAYAAGMRALREHSEEVMVRVMKSREEGKGNFKYIESKDFKREERLAHALNLFLSRFHMRLNKLPDGGECGVVCELCPYRRYNFHSKKPLAKEHWANEDKEGWYCQVECECK